MDDLYARLVKLATTKRYLTAPLKEKAPPSLEEIAETICESCEHCSSLKKHNNPRSCKFASEAAAAIGLCRGAVGREQRHPGARSGHDSAQVKPEHICVSWRFGKSPPREVNKMGEWDGFVNVDCAGMIGKMPTPEGECMFWDTGKKITAEQMKRIKTLQWQAFNGNHRERQDAMNKLKTITNDIAMEANVYPPKFAGMTDDCRIVVNTPWFRERREVPNPPTEEGK